ncbi:MAG: TetR/AcrR family transcriptional regulator [Flavobacteriales bacterium]|nr:TetR/AcrR family transcriptional regulator [Flavobacteriales bacterium]
MKEAEGPWILNGYRIIAEQGFHALTVEGLSREVNKNKSSFYHHFGNIELFIDKLLDYHLERAQIIIEKKKSCNSINPELFHTVINYKTEVLFQRQLLLNKHIPEVEKTYDKITNEGVNAILKIWNKELNLTPESNLGKRLLRLGIDRIFQNVSTNFSITFLEDSLEELKLIAKELRATVQ